MALKSTALSSWCCELPSDILLLPWLTCWALNPWTFLHNGIETSHKQFLSQTGINNLPTYEVQLPSEAPWVSPLAHLHEWCLCPLFWAVPFAWVQATQPAPAAYGLSWPWFYPRLIYELPFWRNIWESMWPSGVTASQSRDVNACNVTDVSNFISKQLQHPQITVFSALPYLPMHTCKSTQTLTSVSTRAQFSVT